ncbi:MAG TPA: thioredoxin family protein [Myxococcota bacterium]|nr:thioredoxin family protein [Myxococcota bacterium]
MTRNNSRTAAAEILPAIAMVALILAGTAGMAAEQGDSQPGETRIPDDKRPVMIEIVPDVAVAGVGQPFRLDVIFRIAPGWHIYAPWPGNTGEPTTLKFGSDNDGVQFGHTSFALPHIYDRQTLDLTAFGYSDGAVASSEVVVLEQPDAGEIELSVQSGWLACKQSCVGGKATAATRLKVAESASPSAGGTARDNLTPAATRLATASAWLSSVSYDDGIWDIKYTLTGFQSVSEWVPQWLPGGECLVDNWGFERGGDGNESWIASVRLRGTDCLPFAGGFLQATEPGSDKPEDYFFGAGTNPANSPWTRATPDQATPDQQDAASLSADTSPPVVEAPAFSWYFLLLAFAGGLLLNIMPCVIPVIVPKLNHLVMTAVTYKERRERYRMLLANGLAYAAGIFVLMMGLATTVVILKAAGHSVGWGFQFQEPGFLAFIISILMVMSLGMLGVFPLQVASHTDDLQDLRKKYKTRMILGSFMTGLLVTILGTPCTAPMLGPAVGFAFMGGPAQIFAFFAALALGFSLPFVLLAVFPRWTDRLKNFRVSEESNRWSHGLAFFLLATMVWLIGVLGSGFGIDAVVRILWFLLLLGAAAWFMGVSAVNFEEPAGRKLKRAESDLAADSSVDARERIELKRNLRKAHYRSVLRRRVITAGMLFAVIMVSAPMILSFQDGAAEGSAGLEKHDGPVKWQKWSREAVEQARKAGKPVFVDVTASWCMNCKTNEKLILNRQQTADLFTEHGIVPMIADFSRRDPSIAALIKQYQRAGVPVYLVYPPCEGEPAVLPELLTEGILADAIKAAGPARDCR